MYYITSYNFNEESISRKSLYDIDEVNEAVTDMIQNKETYYIIVNGELVYKDDSHEDN